MNIAIASYNVAFRPTVTVAVCTRERVEDLALCLDALCRLTYPSLDLLVIDNAPNTDETAHLVRTRYPHVRYAREPRPGLDWARNRAILESHGEIVAFTDDDVIVAPEWIEPLIAPFAEEDVMAATGLVTPLELETDAQVFFELYGGFGCGFERRRLPYERGSVSGAAFSPGLMAECGTGANMAFRRSVFEIVGLFDPALDVGTVTNGGGDIDMFYRVMKGGYALVYEPRAVVQHRHRRGYIQLRKQIEGWGTGFFACLARSAAYFPEERGRLVGLGTLALSRLLRKWLASLVRAPGFPRELFLVELRGALMGVNRYRQARRDADEIDRTYGPLMTELVRP